MPAPDSAISPLHRMSGGEAFSGSDVQPGVGGPA